MRLIGRAAVLSVNLLLLIFLSGCGVLPILNAGPPIYLQHPETGRRAACVRTSAHRDQPDRSIVITRIGRS
jgi:hypothetical protein